MQLTKKLAVLLLTGLLTLNSSSVLASTSTKSKMTAKTVVQKQSVSSNSKKHTQKKKATTSSKTTQTVNQTKLLYGVKGATLKPVKVSDSRKRYQAKGQTHQVIGREASKQYSQTGIASYYGGSFHGKKTANGEVFNKHDFTAAHKTLALGSYALVTNLRNGKQVIVRINDRGPFSHNRIIDLSKGAARELGMIHSGTARVKVEAMQVDRHGFISGKAAKSLHALAKRQGLPVKVKGSGDNLSIKADTSTQLASEVKLKAVL